MSQVHRDVRVLKQLIPAKLSGKDLEKAASEQGLTRLPDETDEELKVRIFNVLHNRSRPAPSDTSIKLGNETPEGLKARVDEYFGRFQDKPGNDK